ncbi:MAG: hypothetical protein U1C18_03155, partial [Patescibacteria group bacterium]|nr:hypothetical protein [Patescibacteria group bacterium]
MSTQAFSISEALRFGWRTTRAHFWFFVQVLLIMALITYGPALIMDSFDDVALPTLATLFFFFAGVVLWVIQLLLSIGLIQIVLTHVDNRKANLEDLFTGGRFLVNYFLGSVLYGLAVMGGLILLIVPGIIVAVRAQFYQYLIIDKNMGPLEALQKSWHITRGSFWNLAVLWLAVGMANIIGILALGVGLFWSIPT